MNYKRWFPGCDTLDRCPHRGQPGDRGARRGESDIVELRNPTKHVPDPEETYTATGWHYELMALLRQFGFRPVRRYEAYKLAVKLLEMGYDR